MPKAPEKRLRSKTPDPARGKSPDPKKLKKAEAKVNKTKGKKAKEDPNQKTLSFKANPVVTMIRAENTAGAKPVKKSKPAKKKMSTEEADQILEEMEAAEPLFKTNP